jgi:hypothetical protein
MQLKLQAKHCHFRLDFMSERHWPPKRVYGKKRTQVWEEQKVR